MTERTKKSKLMPDFFGALAEHMSGEPSQQKKLLQEMERLVADIGAHIHLFTDSEIRERLIDDPFAMVNLTVCSPADRSGRDLRITLELTHSLDGSRNHGKKERLVAEFHLDKEFMR